MTKGFDVTYEVVTPESAEHGDFDDAGFIVENVSLKDALSYWEGEGCHVEADTYPISLERLPRWFTAYQVNQGTREYFEQGKEESRGLHIPDHIGPHSRLRIARLVGCYGIK